MDNTKVLELEHKLKELSNQIVTDTDKLDSFCKQWNNGFHSYSFGNMLLILFQKQDASLCAGYHTWLEHKRFVKRGEHGIAILAPMFFKKQETNEDTQKTIEHLITRFRAVTVFDISQTDGEPIELGHSDKVTGNQDMDLVQITKLFDYPVTYSNGIENGHTDGKEIFLSDRDNKVSMIATYFHELAHCMLGHLDKDNAERGTRDNQELEAEAVSYIVCASLGIQNERSKYYIGHWQGNAEKLGNSGQRIIKTAEKIVRRMEMEVKTPELVSSK